MYVHPNSRRELLKRSYEQVKVDFVQGAIFGPRSSSQVGLTDDMDESIRAMDLALSNGLVVRLSSFVDGDRPSCLVVHRLSHSGPASEAQGGL
jgi:hypothetical protein